MTKPTVSTITPSKGRILRVKTGYNPNSSSIGSHIPEFLAFVAGTGLMAAFAQNLFGYVRERLKGSTVILHGSKETLK